MPMPSFFRLVLAATFGFILAGLITPAQAGVQAITQPSQDLSLGFTISGRVVEVLVEEGQVVEAGQPMARLDDRAMLAQIELHRLRAESELEIQAREAELKLAENEEARVRVAFEQDAASFFEVELAALSAMRANVRVALAHEERAMAQSRLSQARFAHQEATLVAPISGIIELIAIEEGELVQASHPILRLDVIDPLRIDAHVPTWRTLGMTVGDLVPVQLDVPDFELQSPARVVSIASVADSASDTRMVRLELPNPEGRAPAGTGCLVVLDAAASAEP